MRSGRGLVARTQSFLSGSLGAHGRATEWSAGTPAASAPLTIKKSDGGNGLRQRRRRLPVAAHEAEEEVEDGKTAEDTYSHDGDDRGDQYQTGHIWFPVMFFPELML